MFRTKQKLEASLRKTDELPEDWFGTIQASIEDLPSIKAKNKRIRKNIYIDASAAEKIESICNKHNVSFTEVANDILCKFVSGGKKP